MGNLNPQAVPFDAQTIRYMEKFGDEENIPRWLARRKAVENSRSGGFTLAN